ncbi:hypothetical protein DH2020_050024 [Rehmannia glutinosa]|uniref:BHLH domain-containing protein n=1 Tax=Rehmannia glutinosa TaxID=99300 RepID=A0ABR0U146_REHGL
MDFNLMDSYKTETGQIIIHELHKFPQLSNGLYQETSDQQSSDFEFSGGSPAIFTAPPPLFQHFPLSSDLLSLQKMDRMEAMRETIFRVAMMQPIQIDAESTKPAPKRKNVRISKDPQSVAARRRRERISQRIRILQRMVPGGTKLDTASMLDEAVHYLKFLKKQIESLEQATNNNNGRWIVSNGGLSMQMLS